jgi:hypothetical protein
LRFTPDVALNISEGVCSADDPPLTCGVAGGDKDERRVGIMRDAELLRLPPLRLPPLRLRLMT